MGGNKAAGEFMDCCFGVGGLCKKLNGLLEDFLIWDKCEGADRQHSTGKWASERVCLNMEIAKHIIRAPTANKFDDSEVDTSTKESHGTSA